MKTEMKNIIFKYCYKKYTESTVIGAYCLLEVS